MSVVAQGTSPHPAALALGDELVMVLVDDQHEATDPIIHGAPALGWAGDARLAVYYHPRPVAKASTYVLLRLCDDGEYRMICELASEARPLSPAGVNQLIRRLIAIDTQRGFDPHAAVVAHNDALEAERDRRHDDWAENEVAPKLAWAYKRGRGAHLGGSHFDFGGITAPWHDEPEVVATEVAESEVP